MIPAGGRSRAYLNGRPVAQPVLAVLSPLLLTMVGQHSVPQLLSRSAALSAIDDFAGTGERASEMRKAYRRVAALRRRVEEAASLAAGARSRAGTLDFEIGELSGARLVPGEEEALAAALQASRNEGKVLEALRRGGRRPVLLGGRLPGDDGFRAVAAPGSGGARPAAPRRRGAARLLPRGGGRDLAGDRAHGRESGGRPGGAGARRGAAEPDPAAQAEVRDGRPGAGRPPGGACGGAGVARRRARRGGQAARGSCAGKRRPE